MILHENMSPNFFWGPPGLRKWHYLLEFPREKVVTHLKIFLWVIQNFWHGRNACHKKKSGYCLRHSVTYCQDFFFSSSSILIDEVSLLMAALIHRMVKQIFFFTLWSDGWNSYCWDPGMHQATKSAGHSNFSASSPC